MNKRLREIADEIWNYESELDNLSEKLILWSQELDKIANEVEDMEIELKTKTIKEDK